ncbi:MAG TPA: DMT family transporter [Terricaulis sp.]|nr:DMT family transporter [Terricaulis sp.]
MTNLRATYAGLSGNLRGALWMLGSSAAFTLMTTLIKYLGDDYSPGLQAFYRAAAGLVVLLPLILRNPRGMLHTTRPGIMLYRSLAGTLAMVLSFWAYQKMPLADANALSFTRTLWIVPLAIVILHEKIGPWRMGATLVGFGGVLLMLQPDAEGLTLSWPAAAALASAALFATTVTGVKVLTRDHGALTLMAWAAVLGFLLSMPFAIMDWRWPNLIDLALLALMGILGLVTQACYIKGMSLGDAAAMAPIDYMRLIFSILIGLTLFSEVPNLITMIGALIVIASTLFITLRELWVKKQPAPPINSD